MQKNQLFKIIMRSTIALVIPILGQLFVDGWNWGLGDFVFAWVFFNVLGITYTVVTNNIASRGGKIVAGLAVIAIFGFVWVTLATG